LENPASSRSKLRGEELAAIVVVLDSDDCERDGLNRGILGQDGKAGILGVGLASPRVSILFAVHPPELRAGLGDGELGDGRGNEEESGYDVREHGDCTGKKKSRGGGQEEGVKKERREKEKGKGKERKE